MKTDNVILHTSCYSPIAYAAFALSCNAEFLNFSQVTSVFYNLVNESDEVLVENFQMPRVSDFRPYTPVRALDNEILMCRIRYLGLNDSGLPPDAHVMDAFIETFISRLKEHSFTSSKRFYILPKGVHNLKYYVSNLDWNKSVYESDRLESVIKNEYMTIKRLKDLLKEVQKPTYTGKIADPFILNSKAAVVNELIDSCYAYNKLLKETVNDMDVVRMMMMPPSSTVLKVTFSESRWEDIVAKIRSTFKQNDSYSDIEKVLSSSEFKRLSSDISTMNAKSMFKMESYARIMENVNLFGKSVYFSLSLIIS